MLKLEDSWNDKIEKILHTQEFWGIFSLVFGVLFMYSFLSVVLLSTRFGLMVGSTIGACYCLFLMVKMDDSC